MIANTASAEVYRCERDGQVVFSDTPCGSASEKLNIDVHRPSEDDTREAQARDQRRQAFLDQREGKDIRREIDHLREDIDQSQRRMEAELSALRAKKRRANNNLAGATWENSLSQEMQAVTMRYQSDVEQKRREIEDLRDDLAELSR